MKKIIILLAIVMLTAILAVSCGGYVTVTLMTPVGTTAPEASAIPADTTPAPVSSTTLAPVSSTTPVDDTPVISVPSVAPTDMYTNVCTGDYSLYFAEELFQTSGKYGLGWEAWPIPGNEKWCDFAFWQITFTIGADDGSADYIQNINSDDYEYTWELRYKDIESDYVIENFSQSYPCKLETYYDFGNGTVIFRLQTDLDLENGPCKNFEVGKGYEVVISVSKGDKHCGCVYLIFEWNDELAARYDSYVHFWSINDRDRSKGYKAGATTLTEADYDYMRSIGYRWDESDYAPSWEGLEG